MKNEKGPPKSDFLTPDEVGELLRLDGSTVRKKCRDGEWPHVKVANRIRLPSAWVQTLLAPITLSLSAPAV